MKTKRLYRVPLFTYILADSVEQMESTLDVILGHKVNVVFPDLARTVEISSEHELHEVIRSKNELFNPAIEAVRLLNGMNSTSAFTYTEDNILTIARSLEQTANNDEEDIVELIERLSEIVSKLADKYKPDIYPVD